MAKKAMKAKPKMARKMGGVPKLSAKKM